MNLTVHQSISIHMLKVNNVSNSSIIQIGSAGMVRAKSELYNTGGYTEPADPAEPSEPAGNSIPQDSPLVPLAPAT
ncbi:spore germination protein GerPB [Sediminibacillus albus]|uniref:Spore germination protein PB n=1 Tax=Sediminibacillus albus TaxID=407036 RepID=A0A1G8XBC8_9BACI|nr:spore germination protein GerPB [Sediminibacillus albus]SDJ87783.1 spore germination protein PB [Sediminibacillus albus]